MIMDGHSASLCYLGLGPAAGARAWTNDHTVHKNSIKT